MLRICSRKLLSCALVFALVSSCMPVIAYAATKTFVSGGITYTVTSEADAEVAVGAQSTEGVDFAANSGDVVIPEDVSDGEKTYKVTAVNSYAFGISMYSKVASEGAAIASVTLPSTVKTIGEYAFGSCASLKEVSFCKGGSLTQIGTGAFYNCASLSAVEIPATVKTVGKWAFANDPSLASLTFEDPTATEPLLTCDEGSFFLSNTMQGSLESVVLPERLSYVSPQMFCTQSALKVVGFAGKDTLRIDSKAFSGCSSLEKVTIPSLTTKYQDNAIADDAFADCKSLNTLIFLGDETYKLSMKKFGNGSSVDAGSGSVQYSPIKTIVYYGSHTSDLSSFGATVYQALYYYDTEEDAKDAVSLKGSVVVRSDVTLKDIASYEGKSDSKGAYVYEGSVPSAPKGKIWHYLEASASSKAQDCYHAYPDDTTDLQYGELRLEQSVFSYTGETIQLPAMKLYAPDGTEIAILELSATNARGEEVQLDAIKALGTYTLSATAEGYEGTAQATLTVERHDCTVTRVDGNRANSSNAYKIDTAFTEDNTDTVVLVGDSCPVLGASAAGLAGAREAAIVLTADDALSTEALADLKTLKPSSILLVGIEDAEAVSASIKEALDKTVTITNAFVADTPALVSCSLYNRTKSSGIWDEQSTAFVVNGSDECCAVVAGAYAYNAVAPVFLSESDGTLPSESLKALTKDFEQVVFVGDIASCAKGLGAQLRTAGYKGTVDSWTSPDVYQLSAQVAQRQIDEGAIAYDKATLVSASDIENAVAAIATCGRNKAPLIFVDETDGGLYALESFVEPKRYQMGDIYIFGMRSMLSAELERRLQLLYSEGDAANLCTSTVSLSKTTFSYEEFAAVEGALNLPDVTVKNLNGEELTCAPGNKEGSDTGDYVWECRIDRDDKRVASGSACPGAGTYTVTVKGINAYKGTRSVCFSVAGTDISNAELSFNPSKSAYAGKKITPSVTVSCGGKELVKDTDYTVSFRNNKAYGTAVATVTGIGRYFGRAQGCFSISKPEDSKKSDQSSTSKKAAKEKPKKTSIKKLKAAKKRFTVIWKAKGTPTAGYKIQYSTKKNMKKAVTKTIKGAKKTKLTVKKLKRKKTYYVRVCTYTKSGALSKWSKVKRVKVK